ALMLGPCRLDLGWQGLAVLSTAVVLQQRGAGFRAASLGLFTAGELHGVLLRQRFGVRCVGMEGLMTRQALAATFQTLAAAGQGLGVLLQALTRLVEQAVIHLQQLREGSVVQFRR